MACGGSEDSAFFEVETEGGVSGKFNVSWCVDGYRMPEVGLTVEGSKGVMRVNDDELELSLNGGERFRWFRHDLRDDVGFWLGAPEYYREDECFVEAVLRGGSVEACFGAAAKVDRLIDEVLVKAGRVGLVKCETRNVNSVKEAVREALKLIEYSLPKTRKIVIKPNMCYYWDWSTGQTTDPVFVAALIELFREDISSDVEISIVESDASAMKCKYAFKYLGYEKLAKEYNVNLVNLSEVETEKATVKVKDEVFELSVPKIIKDADLRVNVPKMKYMGFTKISAALKNIYGCNPYPKKFQYHSKLDEVIVALNKVMPFNLHVLDGLTVCGSKTLRLGLVMASQDPVAIDAVAATVMGVNPKSVIHLRLAEKEGLGKTSFVIKGVNIDYFRKRFPRKGLSEKAITLGYRVACKLGLDKRLV